MLRKISVSVLIPNDVESAPYDLAIASTGFETRARSVFERFNIRSRLRWAPGFASRHDFDYVKNERFFRDRGFDTSYASDADFGTRFLRWLEDADGASKSSDGGIRLLVDVSSMSRRRMADIIEISNTAGLCRPLQIDVIYNLGQFSGPPKVQAPIVEYGPASPYFAGWDDPGKRVAAVFGVGYEQDQVIGVSEFIEPSDIWLFVPNGPDPRYLRAVRTANETLWHDVRPERRIEYKVLSPLDTLMNLDSLVYGVLRNRRCVLIPFGTKIFAMSCFVVGAIHHPRISVWRVSAGQGDLPQNRHPSKHFCAYTVAFSEPKLGTRESNEISAIGSAV